jgi:hypothetical protein
MSRPRPPTGRAPLAWLALCACAATPPAGLYPVLSAADTDPRAGYERPEPLRASAFLPGSLRQGPWHRVQEEVGSDGFRRLYRIDSEFGPFEAAGDLDLRLRVQEIGALAALVELEPSAAFAAARERAEREPFVARFALVERPAAEVEGMPPAAWQEVLRIAARPPSERSASDAATRLLVLVFERAKREVARRLAISPYSLEPRLQRPLNRVAWACAAGGLRPESVPSLAPASVAPTPEDILPPSRLAGLVGHDSPEDLRRRNRIELALMGVPEDSIQALLAHPAWSPRQQTALVESLGALDGARERGIYVEAALQSETPGDTLFYLMGAVVLGYHHREVAPFERLVRLGPRLVGGTTAGGHLVVPAQVDLLLWTRPVEDFVNGLAAADLPGLQPGGRELWLSGGLSPTARREIEARGVTVVDGVFERVFERLAEPPLPGG